MWFGDGRYLLFSDIPNNRILRWDECTGAFSEFRKPSNHANGLARDRQGRLLACEHCTRRVTRTEYDGRITVLASHYQGKRLNSPNDIVCARDGSIWFTDPPFGILGWWEGEPATPETAARRLPHRPGERRADDGAGRPAGPQRPGLQPRRARAVRGGKPRHAAPQDLGLRRAAGAALQNKRLFVDAGGPGAYDGIAVDVLGNVWCGFGSSGAPAPTPRRWTACACTTPPARPSATSTCPSAAPTCASAARSRNRLFMAGSHSLYALYVNVQGAVP